MVNLLFLYYITFKYICKYIFAREVKNPRGAKTFFMRLTWFRCRNVEVYDTDSTHTVQE